MVTQHIASDIFFHFNEAELAKPKFKLGDRIPLNIPTYGAEEVIEALDSLMSTWVTMGKKVETFERMFAEYIGVQHAVMVNSGSSANLLALSTLTHPDSGEPLSPGDEIITPALTWATTVFPIAQLGLKPVLVDVSLDTFNLDPAAVEQAITPRTKAIMPVHLLGNPCDMTPLIDLANRHDIFLIEDACEAHGAEYEERKVGSFGNIGTFSFFFSHHISTIEGGMVVTNEPDVAEIVRYMRSFGWIRGLSDEKEIADLRPDIDPRFLFVYPGYNLRPTDIQGAFGMHQLPKLDGFIEHRRNNAAFLNGALSHFEDYLILPKERPGTKHVWFAYPIMVRPGAPFTKTELVKHLESRGLETRQIEAGNMAIQPAMRWIDHDKGDLTNSQLIHDNAFFIGNHHGMGEPQLEAIAEYFVEFLYRWP